MTEIISANIIIMIFELIFSIIVITLAWLAAQQFAKELGTGMRLLTLAMTFMVVNFFFGMIDHMELAGIVLPFVHPGWLHGMTILIALIIMTVGFYEIYKVALSVRKMGSNKK